MPVTITYKTSLAMGADPAALKKMKLCKVFGAIIPLSPGDDAANEALLAKYNKDRKFEAELRAKCEEAAKTDQKAFKALAKTYLSSKRCLRVALFEDNARQPLENRKSLEALIALANKYKILKKLKEPARVWQQPKASGKGMRVVCSFGPVAQAAQHMVKKLLTMAYQPQNFQFAKLSFAEKVQLAMHAINEKGYAYITEIDIKDFFPSFTKEALIKSLPLPIEAIRQIVLSESANWNAHPLYIQYAYIPSPPGIPQGSASSAAVADWCIANMSLKKLSDTVVINHADNFFAFSLSSDGIQSVSKALNFGIAGLPGGDFLGETEQSVTIMHGFQMLGCWVDLLEDGLVEAYPTDPNLKALRERAGRQRQRAYGRLKQATVSQSKQLRLKGLQDYLRFESICDGWVQAFAFCDPIMMSDIKDEYDQQMSHLRHTFKITDAELKPLKDASTEITVKWYSGP